MLSFNPFSVRGRQRLTTAPLVDILRQDSKWRAARSAYIELQDACEVCRTRKRLEVHHIQPWHLAPALRYDAGNLMTMCRHCHFHFGHGGNWRNFNPTVRTLAVNVRAAMLDIQTS